jgi:putative phosphonate metabolism protein
LGRNPEDAGSRYAIYFVPAKTSRLYRFGSAVLGYDAYTGAAVEFPHECGDAVNWNELTARPRRYGFHATLKAPFHLAPSCSERQLVSALQSFAALGHVVRSFTPAVRALSDFFAVVPERPEASLDVLAESCTKIFDAYRAPMTPQERARRIASGLSQSQVQNLDRWGYPYVLTDFRFHMTLTGAVPARRKKAVLGALLEGFHRMQVENSIAVDRLALAKQETPDAPFRILSEARLTSGPAARS